MAKDNERSARFPFMSKKAEQNYAEMPEWEYAAIWQAELNSPRGPHWSLLDALVTIRGGPPKAVAGSNGGDEPPGGGSGVSAGPHEIGDLSEVEPLNDDHIAILHSLATRMPSIQSQIDITQNTGLARGTQRKLFDYLEEIGYVAPPPTGKQGYVITKLGRRAHELIIAAEREANKT